MSMKDPIKNKLIIENFGVSGDIWKQFGTKKKNTSSHWVLTPDPRETF
ncbi:MAG: hypothetical protein ABSH06_01745 [Thermodesulfobacteriota bacterium]